MEAIRIKRKVKSSTLRIKELGKFKNKDVLISITPVSTTNAESSKDNVSKMHLIEELLTISKWNIDEENLKVKSWKIPDY